MANWSTLKQAIANVIKTNGNQEITGHVLQNTLFAIVNSVGENYTFVGVADTSTEPGSPDGHVFYIASKGGEYSNFGGIIIDKEVAIIRNTADGSWEKISTGIASVESLIEGGEIVVKVDIKPATETILGGINASPKTEEETVEAKIGEDNKLYVPASTSAKNLADEEDLTSEVEDSKSVMKFADKLYDTSSFSGQGRVYLRKNIVLGKNVLTQSMINDANTRYIIQYDYDLNGETVTVPEGCTLDFQGGSLFNGIIDANGCDIIGDGILCDLLNYNSPVNLKLFRVGEGSDPSYNRKVIQYLIDNSYFVVLPTGTITLDKEITVNTSIRITSESGREKCKLLFPNGKGFVWNTPFYSTFNKVSGLSIESKDICIDFYNDGGTRPYNVYWSEFTDLTLQCNQGEACIYAGSNKGYNNDTMVFDCKFEDIYVKFNEYGLYGLSGNSCTFRKIQFHGIGNPSSASIVNCAGLFESINGCWGNVNTFYKSDYSLLTSPVRYSCTFQNCNIESYKWRLFDCTNANIYMKIQLLECTAYISPDNDDDKTINYYPFHFGICWEFTHIGNYYVYNNSAKFASGFGLFNLGYFPSDNSYPVCVVDKDMEVYDNTNKSRVIYKSGLTTTVPAYSQIRYGQSMLSLDRVVSDIVYSLMITYKPVELEIDETKAGLTLPEGQEYIISSPTDTDGSSPFSIAYIYIPILYKSTPWIFRIKNSNKYRTLLFKHDMSYNNRVFCLCGSDVSLLPGETAEFYCTSYVSNSYAPCILSSIINRLSAYSGSTTYRPSHPTIGQMYYDKDAGKPVWWNGTNWVDANGSIV